MSRGVIKSEASHHEILLTFGGAKVWTNLFLWKRKLSAILIAKESQVGKHRNTDRLLALGHHEEVAGALRVRQRVIEKQLRLQRIALAGMSMLIYSFTMTARRHDSLRSSAPPLPNAQPAFMSAFSTAEQAYAPAIRWDCLVTLIARGHPLTSSYRPRQACLAWLLLQVSEYLIWDSKG